MTANENNSITLDQAAKRLALSRSTLYKFLERGGIPIYEDGQEHHIRLCDLAKFETQRQTDRHELAVRFAHQRETTAAVEEEIGALL